MPAGGPGGGRQLWLPVQDAPQHRQGGLWVRPFGMALASNARYQLGRWLYKCGWWSQSGSAAQQTASHPTILAQPVAEPFACSNESVLALNDPNRWHCTTPHSQPDSSFPLSCSNESVLALKDPNRPFPTGAPLGVLKWRLQVRVLAPGICSSSAPPAQPDLAPACHAALLPPPLASPPLPCWPDMGERIAAVL